MVLLFKRMGIAVRTRLGLALILLSVLLVTLLANWTITQYRSHMQQLAEQDVPGLDNVWNVVRFHNEFNNLNLKIALNNDLVTNQQLLERLRALAAQRVSVIAGLQYREISPGLIDRLNQDFDNMAAGLFRLSELSEKIIQLEAALAGITVADSEVSDKQRKLMQYRQQRRQLLADNQLLSARLAESAGNTMSIVSERMLASEDQFASLVEMARYGLIAIPIIIALVVAFIYWLIDRSVLQRVIALDADMQLLTQGKSATLDISGNDEISDMAKAASYFSKALIKREQEAVSARVEAETANAAKSRFLANVSHEVRTPMTGLLAAVELLKQTPLNNEQQRLLAVAEETGETQLTLLNDLLDISSAEAGHIQLDIMPLELNSLLTSLETLSRPRAEAKGLQLVMDTELSPLSTGELWLQGDAVRLRQVLLNLLHNAIKFTDCGTVSMTSTITAPGNINSKESLVPYRIDFCVADTGIGISAEQQQQVFSPFQQARQSNPDQERREQRGTGLGLAICRELVYLMGGDIQLHSVEGEGSQFHFVLELLPADKPLAALVSPVTTLPLLDILLVDDEALNLSVVASMLRDQGHRVATAASGAEAINRFAEHTPDIVLMDIWLPDIDGIATLKKLRERFPDHTKVPVFAFTASLQEEDRERYLRSGMAGVLSKPLRLEEFKQLIASAYSEKTMTADSLLASVNTMLDERAGLALSNHNPVRYKKVLALFVEQYQPLADGLLNVSVEHFAECEQSVHQLINGAGLIGADPLSRLAEQVEVDFHRGQLQRALLQSLSFELDKVLAKAVSVRAELPD